MEAQLPFQAWLQNKIDNNGKIKLSASVIKGMFPVKGDQG